MRISASSLDANVEIGRVCGTSASIAPSVMMPSTSATSAASMISATNARQLRDGSVPSSTKRLSRSIRSSGSVTSGATPRPRARFAGPHIVAPGQVSRFTPCSSVPTVGRLNW